MPTQGISNEYQHHMFSWGNKKKMFIWIISLLSKAMYAVEFSLYCMEKMIKLRFFSTLEICMQYSKIKPNWNQIQKFPLYM